MLANLAISQTEIDTFCQRWNVSELALFGSVLRTDFTDNGDVDVLVTFKPGTAFRFGDLMQMEGEIAAIFGRKVDLGTRRSVEQDPNYL